MTCIVGIAQGGKVYMGGDSASAAGWEVKRTTLSKVFRINGFIIGYTSSFRMGQLLEHRLDVPSQKEGVEDLAYMVKVFIESVRQCLKDGGYTKIESNREESGTFLVGYKGRLYIVCDDFQVNESRDGFNACGCGSEYALGALKIMDEDNEPRSRIRKALKVAAWFSGGVVEPFKVIYQ